MSALLRTEGLTKQFGGLVAVDGVDFSLEEGELRCVIGPNGAGKTTFFNLLTGALEPTEGSVYLGDENIVGKEPREILKQGMARSFQISQLFNGLTVMENIRLGLLGTKRNQASPSFVLSNLENDEELKAEAYEIAERVNLGDVADDKVSALPHGRKRNLELGVALSTDSKVLLLDEPAAGLTTEETRELVGLIEDLAEDQTILLVEHDMDVVMGIAERITVLHNGQIIAEGTPEEIQQNETVKEVYLGE
jgi:branched-chain amino acid transport system ATP-binding protein